MMKKIFLFILLLSLPLLAQDVYNVGTVYNGNSTAVPSSGNIVAYWEDFTTVVYKFRFTYTSDTDNYHSKPLYIGDCNAVDGYVYGKADAAGNTDAFFHFSADDRNTWETTTPADLNALSNTAVVDTIGIEAGTNDISFHAARWLVIEADGQASNDGDVLTIIVKLTKDKSNPATASGSFVPVARVAVKSNTNP